MKELKTITRPEVIKERTHPLVCIDYISFDLAAWEKGCEGGTNPHENSSAAYRSFEMGRRGISPFDLAKVLSES